MRRGTRVATTLKRYATPTPSAMSVNMFGLRLTIDCHPRAKKGAPPHSTTGVASASWTQIPALAGTRCRARPGSISLIASRNTGTVSARLTRNRRVMSTSSSFSGSSAVISSGSSAMPHSGQDPGPIWRTSGCIGHVYSTCAAGAGAGVCGWAAWPGRAPAIGGVRSMAAIGSVRPIWMGAGGSGFR